MILEFLFAWEKGVFKFPGSTTPWKFGMKDKLSSMELKMALNTLLPSWGED